MFRFALGSAFLLVSAAEALARHGHAHAHGHGRISAPEIDGPGGIAAISVLVAIAMLAYDKLKT